MNDTSAKGSWLRRECIRPILRSSFRLPVPKWAFQELGRPVEDRKFRYADMLYNSGRQHDRWRPGASVPDMSKPETQLWFYYRARRYLDCGIEAIHFGQVMIMDDADPGHRHWQAFCWEGFAPTLLNTPVGNSYSAMPTRMESWRTGDCCSISIRFPYGFAK